MDKKVIMYHTIEIYLLIFFHFKSFLLHAASADGRETNGSSLRLNLSTTDNSSVEPHQSMLTSGNVDSVHEENPEIANAGESAGAMFLHSVFNEPQNAVSAVRFNSANVNSSTEDVAASNSGCDLNLGDGFATGGPSVMDDINLDISEDESETLQELLLESKKNYNIYGSDGINDLILVALREVLADDSETNSLFNSPHLLENGYVPSYLVSVLEWLTRMVRDKPNYSNSAADSASPTANEGPSQLEKEKLINSNTTLLLKNIIKLISIDDCNLIMYKASLVRNIKLLFDLDGCDEAASRTELLQKIIRVIDLYRSNQNIS